MWCVNMEMQLVGYITLFTLVHCNVAQHLEIPIMWAGKEKASAEREEIVEYGKEKEGNKTVHCKGSSSDENKCFYPVCVELGVIFKQTAKGDLGSMCGIQQMIHTLCRLPQENYDFE